MPTQQLDDIDFSVVSRMLEAIERGDMDTMRRCFAPEALIWHNHDGLEMDVESTVGRIGYLCAVSTSREYKDRRMATVGSVVFIQHTLTAGLLSGRRLEMLAIMRIELDADGLVMRMEEYLDSRAVDCLGEEVPGEQTTSTSA